MKIGDCLDWALELMEYSQENSELLTEWQQKFVASFSGNFSQYEEGTFVSEKQLDQLNKIAEAMGVNQVTEADLDD